MCRQKKGTVDEAGSPFSDDTWNSHNHHFVRTLKGATPQLGECDVEDERLDSSSGKGAMTLFFTLRNVRSVYILLEESV
jgi:hypothetical protein